MFKVINWFVIHVCEEIVSDGHWCGSINGSNVHKFMKKIS